MVSLGSGAYYLQFPDGTPFGYFSRLVSSLIYHYDLGYQAVLAANDADNGVYMYDFATGHWFYPTVAAFPNIYDFGQGRSGGCHYSSGIMTVGIMPAPSTPMSATRRAQQNARLELRAQRFHELKRGLDQLEYFCKGTVLKRMMKCGKAACACHSDSDKRHGPYFELTYKAKRKNRQR